jgi:phage tail-like protein
MRRDDWLLQQLPVGMSEQQFLRRFLQIFQHISDTVLHQIDQLDHVFDPTVAPDAMVRAMGEWIGVDWVDSSLDHEVQRRAIIEYARILPWRGTARGLRSLLELIGDGEVVVEDSGGVHAEGEAPNDPPHVRLAMEPSAWANHDDIVRIVRSELPATVTFELRVGTEQVWPPDPSSGGDQRETQEVS